VSSQRWIAYTVATIVAGVVVVQFVRSVGPAVANERGKRARAACAGVQPGPAPSNPTLGRFPTLAPDFTAQAHNGQAVSLSAYRGKVVFLNFWATWCDTCREEMPSMDQLQRTFGDKDFVVLAVASDDSWDKVRAYFKRGTAMTVLLDPPPEDETAAAIANRFGTRQLPETYIIDREGNIRYYFVSTRNWMDRRALSCIKALIEE
jgi:peroxiredoxin